MIIGVPKEIMHGEARVAASPEAVQKYVADGHTVLFERGAGEGAGYHDPEYLAAGAEMIDGPVAIFDRAEIIIKVKEPLFNEELGKHEIDMMHRGQYIITFIHPASPVNHDMVRKMAQQGVIGLTLDGVPRISRAQNLDALTSMSTCAGYKGILMAANDLAYFMPQMFTAVGQIPPAKAMVLGVGVAGLQALATARRLGCVTYAADIRPAAAEQATSLGAKTIDLGIPADKAIAPGGYAMHLSEDLLEKERAILAEHIKEMDIVFCSALVPGKIAPILITEEMVKTMKPGAVIVDISIDQGGNCAITPAGKREVKHGVVLEGIKNIPGMLPKSSTWMFSQNMYHLVKYLVKDGKVNLDMSDEICQKILVTRDGEIVHEGTLEAMNLKK